jgi:hypothetical protein
MTTTVKFIETTSTGLVHIFNVINFPTIGYKMDPNTFVSRWSDFDLEISTQLPPSTWYEKVFTLELNSTDFPKFVVIADECEIIKIMTYHANYTILTINPHSVELKQKIKKDPIAAYDAAMAIIGKS